ncbi:MAG: peptidoglycan bridge formation glycyltransferase FemA/FemB family protein [Bacilli bacterium]|nr:peptidoglycan bridge formation glycyltransferase FemA/FemB family protein [Bacilli bacterium]
MKIITLTKQQFDAFSSTHRYRSFYQSSLYGELMMRHGFNIHYVGLVDNNHNLISASLILYKKIFNIFKYAYAPRGFLIEYEDKALLKLFTSKLKRLLLKQNFLFIKIDPYVVRDSNILLNLKSAGYIKQQTLDDFKLLKPTNFALLKLNTNTKTTFFSFKKDIRRKIKSALKKGITIHKGNANDIETIYNFAPKVIKKKQSLTYFNNYYQVFKSQNKAEVYYAKLNPSALLTVAKNKYQEENKININLVKRLQQDKKNNDILNKKIASDNLLNLYKRHLIEASKLFNHYPHGLIIGGCFIIIYDNQVNVILSSYHPKYKRFNPIPLLYWALITNAYKKHYHAINLNGLSSHSNGDDPYQRYSQFKLKFGSTKTELIGEFDLPINLPLYHFIQKSKLITNYITKIIKKN